ncbi:MULTISPECIES: hybrid sensor histidine kinase/response regulator [Protofrankia]|uniref:histidine kinase n=1 Tax=Protofrankia coriariae TaxID=1562887 RepID=A0ABR5F7T8_9ACTN|nr:MULTISPECIES: hybrid sensor histidine kinase/response regulator [Protofrankia]KLL12742.1 histidine kinase [Protofrankia coriariae]ONH36089.1 hybrid sensor histidine kinase/response regulator [Protofrankia sp. BMG5.30]
MVPRTLLDALTSLVVLVGADGRVLDAGAAARTFLGERLAGTIHLRDLIDVVEPSSRVRLRDVVPRALSRTGQWRGTVDLVDTAGNPAPYLLSVRADPDGGFVIAAQDTEDVRAREAAERESRAKDEFVARLGHELRTPLNAVLGFAQLLELEPLAPELHDDVERIITGGRHMQALIDDVLDLARLRAGRGDINKGPVNVLEIVQGVVELVEPLAAQRGIRRVISPAEPLVADADRRRLWQVLLNLVGNALKYGREGGTVRVGIVPVTGGRVRIEVEDDGNGLPPEAMNRLFRPFERLGAERSGVEGSGLGLALSHALVTAMGGVLTAASRYRVGSVFAVVLDTIDVRFDDAYGDPDDDDGFAPVPAVTDRPSAGSEPGTEPVDSRLRVVHVSGDPATRAMVTHVLRSSLGADTVCVPRAALALDAVRRSRPALVLLDRILPDAPVEELLRVLAADATAGQVPAVVLTTDDDPRDLTKLRQAGAVGVVGAPLDVNAVIAAAGHLAVRNGGRHQAAHQ